MMFDEETDVTSRVEARFNAETSWIQGVKNSEPTWYRRLLAAIVLVIGDGDIRYFSAGRTVSTESTSSVIDVVVITDEIVAYASFTGTAEENDEVPLKVTAVARRALSTFSVSADDNGDVKISVTYPDFAKTLPLGESEWPFREAETTNLIECLRRDLVA